MANQAPMATASTSLTFAANQTIAATQLYTSAPDPDGTISTIRFCDVTARTANSYFMLDGVRISSSFAVGGYNDIVVEACDNLGLDSYDLQVRVNTTAPTNQAPVVDEV